MKKSTFIILLLICFILTKAQDKELVLWSFQTNNKIFSHPVLDNNTVYFGSLDSNFYAVDILTGNPVWSYKTNSGIYSKALVNNNIVYFKSGNDVFAINKNTSEKIWSSEGNDASGTGQIDPWDYHSGSPAIYKNLIYFGLANGKLLGFDLKNGKLVSELINPDSSAIKSSILIQNSILYFGTWKGNIYSYNLETGLKQWEYHTYKEQPYATFGMVNSQFTIHNKLLYFGTRNPEMQIIDIETGKQKWNYIEKEGGWISGDPLVKHDIMYIGGSDNHEMFAFNAQTGEKYWTFEFLNNNFSKPLVYKDYLLFATVDSYSVYGTSVGRGFLYAINKKNGSIINFFQIGGNAHSSPIIKNEVLLLTNEDGNLYAIDLVAFLNDKTDLKTKGYNAVDIVELSPMPFTDNLTIKYLVNYSTNIKISITDLNEEEVVVLYSGEKDSGEHTILWDGKDADDGYYFVEINSGIYFKKTFVQKKSE